MSSHDEYSSDEEDVVGGSSSVFLGYTDVAFEEEGDTPTIDDTFIGGQPVWLHPKSAPPAQDLECRHCHRPMALLLQASAPLETESYDRVIYIFACKNSQTCLRKEGLVKAFRGVCKDPERMAAVEAEQAEAVQRALDEKLRLEEKKKFQIEMTKDLFSATQPTANPFGSANPFGANPFGSKDQAEQVEQKLEKKPEQIAEPKPEQKHGADKLEKSTTLYAAAALAKTESSTDSAEPSTSVPLALPEYPGYFLFTEVEKFPKVSVEPELEKYKHLIEESTAKEGRSMLALSGSGALNPETRKIASMLNDKHFENFSSTVGYNPAQVLRYDLGGKPLLYSGTDSVARTVAGGFPEPSYNPSSLRRFELQLMPKAILDLEKGTYNLVADIMGGMSWGTIIVATDAQDYMPRLDENHVGYVAEYCGVQWEESV